jgi:hypothetical protein
MHQNDDLTHQILGEAGPTHVAIPWVNSQDKTTWSTSGLAAGESQSECESNYGETMHGYTSNRQLTLLVAY